MKNTIRIIGILVFTLIGCYLGFSCYRIETPTNHPTCTSLFGQLNLGFEHNPPFIIIGVIGLLFTLFLPTVIVISSFFYQLRFKSMTRLLFICVFLASLFFSSLSLIVTGIYVLNIEVTHIYWVMPVWNFSGTLWALLLALPVKKRIALIHWPFENREDKKTA